MEVIHGVTMANIVKNRFLSSSQFRNAPTDGKMQGQCIDDLHVALLHPIQNRNDCVSTITLHTAPCTGEA
jgi:hypothetical protein